MNNESNAGEQRDATSLRVMGFFFCLLGVIVLIATFWALEHPRAAIVNAISGGTLAVVGIVMLTFGRSGDR